MTSTLVFGTVRGDHPVTQALKAAKFKWSTNIDGRQIGAWYLPRPWGYRTRNTQVEVVTRSLTRLGRTWTGQDSDTWRSAVPEELRRAGITAQAETIWTHRVEGGGAWVIETIPGATPGHPAPTPGTTSLVLSTIDPARDSRGQEGWAVYDRTGSTQEALHTAATLDQAQTWALEQALSSRAATAGAGLTDADGPPAGHAQVEGLDLLAGEPDPEATEQPSPIVEPAPLATAGEAPSSAAVVASPASAEVTAVDHVPAAPTRQSPQADHLRMEPSNDPIPDEGTHDTSGPSSTPAEPGTGG